MTDHLPDPQPIPFDSIFKQQGDGEPREPRARLIVVGHVSHQQAGEDATTTELAHVRLLKSAEQPVRRRMTVGEAWEPLFRGWLESCSAVVIRNHEGERPQRIPSEVEKQAAALKVVEIAFGDAPALMCPPGETQGPFCPCRLDCVFVRCRSGSAKITVDIVPE